MLNLSACVITKNEEKNLPVWIDCMKKIAIEMIVVDTGSTDKTIEIARSSGAKVYKYKWDDDFSAAKNAALEKACGDWILFLDADEYFAEESIAILPQCLEKAVENKNVDALLCKMVNVDVDNNNSIINVFDNLRIIRRSSELRFQNKVHEILSRKNGPLRLAYLDSNIKIYHTGYSKTIIRGKLERNLQLLMNNMNEEGDNPWSYAYFADCYYGLGEYDKAIDYAKKSIAAKIKHLGEESTIYRRLIDAMALSGKSEQDILSVVEVAIVKFPNMPEFVWNKGELLFIKKDYIAAEKWLLKAMVLQKKKGEELSGSFSGRENLMYYRLGQIAVLRNDRALAITYYAESLGKYRYNRTVLEAFYQLLRSDDAVTGIMKLRSIYNESKQDMEFIREVIGKYPLDYIYLYYCQCLHNSYGIKELEISVNGFLITEKYNLATDASIIKIKNAYEFMIVSLIVEYEDKKYQIARTLLPNPYKNVLDKYLNHNVILNDEEEIIYNKIKSILLKMNIDAYKDDSNKN